MRFAATVLIVLIVSQLSVTAQTQQEIDDLTKQTGVQETKSSTLSALSGKAEYDRDYAKALELYKQLAKVYAESPAEGTRAPTYAWALAKQGYCEFKLGHRERAESLCKEALAIIGDDTPDSNFSYSGQIRSTFQSCRAVGIKPDDDLLTAAQLEQKARGLSQLLVVLEQGKHGPRYCQTLCSLARIYGKLGRVDDSKRLYERAITAVGGAPPPLRDTFLLVVLENERDMLVSNAQEKSAFVVGMQAEMLRKKLSAPGGAWDQVRRNVQRQSK